MRFLYILALLFVTSTHNTSIAQAIPAKEIIKNAADLMNGQTNESVMRMTIIRPTWQRTIAFHSWAKGNDYSMALITDPAKEKGQSFLKRKNEMWNWIPAIQRLVKLPPSMLSQGWMGSDFSNDDLMKESSIVRDYEHSILGVEYFDNVECYKIKLVPKAEAAVVWGSIIKFISKKHFFQLKTEYYDEDNILIKTEKASVIKLIGDREIPTHFEIIPNDKPGNKTLVDIEKVVFNKPIDDSFFSQQNMKNLR